MGFIFDPEGKGDATMTISGTDEEVKRATKGTTLDHSTMPIMTAPAPMDFLDSYFAANKNKGGTLLKRTGTGRKGTFLTEGASFAPEPIKNPFDRNY